MGPTPLYDSLKDFAATSPLRLHVPGHKGKALPMPELSGATPLDFTELSPTGDLFAGEGAVMEAQALWAARWDMAHCLFLTGGSTQGVLAALTLAAGDGGAILLDRGSHRSAYHALALLDAKPVYLDRPWLEEEGVFAPVSPQSVEKMLKTHPGIKTICITSPTYYGLLSDVPAISTVVRRHGGKLVVDAAHGAHLPFLGNRGLAAADLVVSSAHKGLPALGQSALLFAGKGSGFSHSQLRRAGSLYGSSSPSYLLMASLDTARAYMEGEGAARYRALCTRVAALRRRFPSLTEGPAPLDPARLVLKVNNGFAAQKGLEAQGVYAEMADSGHLVFVLTCADGEEELTRLEEALERLDWEAGDAPPLPGPPPAPEMALSPRRAYFSPSEAIPLSAALDRVSAGQIAPYPPGVPVVAPGERICKKHLAYLTRIGYNMGEAVQVVLEEEIL